MLLSTLRLAPAAPWRVPLALVGGLWAPGYALLAAVHPVAPEGLRGWERHALGFGIGLLAAPLVGLLASLLLTFDETTAGALLCAVTLAGAAVGLLRSGPAPRFAHSPPPGTLPTLAICAATSLVVAALWLAPVPGAGGDAPAALGLLGPDGTPSSLPLRVERGADALALVEVAAGARAEDGLLRVTWGRAEGGPEAVLVDEALALRAGETARRELAMPTSEPGFFRLAVAWEGPRPLRAHAWVEVVAEAGP